MHSNLLNIISKIWRRSPSKVLFLKFYFFSFTFLERNAILNIFCFDKYILYGVGFSECKLRRVYIYQRHICLIIYMQFSLTAFSSERSL